MKAAHFLWTPTLVYSPPNEAIVQALLDLGCDVDLYTTANQVDVSAYGERVTAYHVEYRYKWILQNTFSYKWQRYNIISGTSEDPMGVVGVLAKVHHIPCFALVDEIRSGSYAGNASPKWKKLCQYGMRNSKFRIVNDKIRTNLLREYLNMPGDDNIIVYPGCFRNPPESADTAKMRLKWNVKNDNLVIADSGYFYHEHSALWITEALSNRNDINLVIQALNIDPFAGFLLTKIKGAERIYIEPERLEWRDAWSQMGAADIGVAVYRQEGPQFKKMGISSNRLCMFLAMGVPVIVSKQKSFEFVEKYDCGVMVNNEHEFTKAIDYIKPRLQKMKQNALICTREYIDAQKSYDILHGKIYELLK